jgi:hypothetical protein
MVRKTASSLSAIILIFIFVFCQGFTAFAKVNYTLESLDCDNNKLFDVILYGDGDLSLSATKISLEYNTKYVEYRSVSTVSKVIDIYETDNNGKIDVILLSSQGYKFSGKTKLLDFKFKSIDDGNADLKLSVSDSVTGNLKSTTIGKVEGCSVTINGSTVNGTTSTKNKSVKNGSSAKSKSTSLRTNSSANTANIEAKGNSQYEVETATETGEPNSSSNTEVCESDDYSSFFIGGMIVVALVILFAVAYRLGKFSKNKSKDDADREE